MATRRREGWLLHECAGTLTRRAWQRRWFSLKDDCLLVFDRQSDRTPRRVLPLSGEGVQVQVVHGGRGKRPHVLLIETIRKTHFVACSDLGELYGWVHALKMVAAAPLATVRYA